MQAGVILIDPPWEFETRSKKGLKKSAQKHYDCMSLDELKAMRDNILFASGPDCICIMWTTFCFLDQAMDLMASYGFKYRTSGVWNKVTKNGKQCFGTGYGLRNSAEIFLIGTIGNPKFRNKKTRDSQFSGVVPANLNELDNIVINAIRREHSRKPSQMYTLIEGLFNGPYLEVFARHKRRGWTCWGNEIKKFKEE